MPEHEPNYLPRADEAWVPDAKLRDYALDSEHAAGRHKAIVFRSALGLERQHWEYLRNSILAAVPNHPVTRAEHEPPDIDKYEVVLPILGLNGKTVDVITGWIIERSAPPRLTSAYVCTRRRH